MSLRIEALCEETCHLGEGPVWDDREAALYWVDSLGPTLYRHDHGNGQLRRWTLPGSTVGSLALRDEGGLILAMDQGIYAFDQRDGQVELLVSPLAGKTGLRLNDGKVDPFGCFVTGAMNIDHRDSEPGAM